MKKIACVFFIIFSYGVAVGAERLFYEGFESGSLASVSKTSGVTISRLDPLKGNYCARVQFGPEEGNQLIAKRVTSGISNEIYVKYNIKLDPDYWQGDESFKPFRAFNNYRNSPAIELWSGGCGKKISGHINTGDGKYAYTYSSNYNYKDVGVAPNWYGNWSQIEVYIKRNSAVGIADGIYKVWWNGVLVYSNGSVQHLNINNQFYDTFYFPSNMNCDLGRLDACCNWDKVTPFYAYVDEIEVWNGLPATVGESTAVMQSPTGLKVK